MRRICCNLLLALMVHVGAVPYILLKNKAPKCFQVDARSRTTMLITYHAPDLVRIEDQDVASSEELTKERTLEDGPDTFYNERFQKRMDVLKKAHLKDINISVTPRDSTGAIISNRDAENANGNLPVKVREQIENPEGSFTYKSGDLEGSLEVCIQSYTATAESPSRVAFDVKPLVETDDLEKILEHERNLLNKKVETENEIVKEETSRITTELMRMHRRAQGIAADAQYDKKREEEFRKKSITLNRAVRYWPMFRMFVLLLSGYLQISHVVDYMKRRHIC